MHVSLAGLIGPDGVGKSTLLALIAGVRRLQTGDLHVLDGSMRDGAHRQKCYGRIAYMPQGLGRNLYPTLSVFENLDFVGRLFGLSSDARTARIDELLASTGLQPFHDRPAGKLSGGMKQKLSLCGALIHDPDLLILDEPTTGVDPLSRRQFWELVDRIRTRREHMSVVVATAYMEEAERFDWLAAMDGGQVIATGEPAELKARTGTTDLESAFVSLLPAQEPQAHQRVHIPQRVGPIGPPVIEAEGLTKRFGKFVAVDHVSFRIERGEIFGFLGSNGCGKSTTMKMLTGLLPASEGSASVLGEFIDGKSMAARRRVGYMSQAFSLYNELTVRQNLELHARLFGLSRDQQRPRLEEMLDHFRLRDVAGSRPDSLPLGIRQRLQLAVAVQHRPEILILDEPTSGVDPVTRDEFWRYMIDLARNDGVTIFLSTHFMNEAERCDRISLMHAGKVLAVDTPRALVEARGTGSLEEAFIEYLEDASGAGGSRRVSSDSPPVQLAPSTTAAPRRHLFDVWRSWAYARRECVEILRDPMRLAFAVLGPIILMATFGYGISFDVEHLAYAVLDRDQTPASRELLASFQGSRYFERKADLHDPDQIETRLRNGELALAIEIPPEFGKDLLRGRAPELGLWLDGSMPFRAETARGYVSGVALAYLSEQAARRTGGSGVTVPVRMETRFRYNQAFKSIYAIVPSVLMLALILIPSIMAAVGVVREKETGSIANFRSTPVTRLEFLIGKQLPYVVIGFVNVVTLVALSVLVFGVPVRGSSSALLAGVVFYVLASTGFGLVVSAFVRTQVAAVFATAVIAMIPSVNFSGLLVPVSSLSGGGRVLGLAFPSAWFQQISVGTFTKNLGFPELWINHVVLAAFAVTLVGTAALVMRKQEA